MSSTSCSWAWAISELIGSTTVSTLFVSLSASSCSYGLSMSTTTSADLLGLLSFLGRGRGVGNVRQDLGVVGQVGCALRVRVRGGPLLAGVALRSHAHGLPLALLRLDDLDQHVALVVLRRLADLDGRAGRHRLRQHLVRERILDVALDGPAQRARAHRGVPALLHEEVRGVA